MNLITRWKLIRRMKQYKKRLDAMIPPLSEQTKKKVLTRFMLHDCVNWEDKRNSRLSISDGG